jgi:mRNA-degrading endonuclease RelE of RelBE toxin-antitoxin system
MDQIKKQWNKINEKDREKIREIFEQLNQRNFKNLKREKLQGYDNIYRIRVGKYRIIYFDDKQQIILKYLKKRDEKTYREI